MDFIKNNDKLDHLLESGIVNVRLLKDDDKYNLLINFFYFYDWDRKQRCLWGNECHLIKKETNGKMIKLKKKKPIKYK